MSRRHWAIVGFALTAALYVIGFVLSLLAGEPFSLASMVALALFAFPVVGLLVAYRRPDNRIAWICLAVGLAWGMEQAFWGAALYGMSGSGAVAGPELWAAIGNPFWVPGTFIVPTYILMLFPDGSLPSRKWRWLPWLTGIVISAVFVITLLQPQTSGYGRPATDNPLYFSGDLSNAIVYLFEGGLLFGLLLACVVGSVVSVIVRYRRSSGLERKQLKWLATAGAVAAGAFLPSIVLEETYGETLPLAAALTLVLIPVAIGIAVTRYRLYEIDRIISRTVTYGVVVAVLAGVFLGVVTVLSSLLSAESDLAIAGSTLAVAALFNPLRRRVQGWLDRRFNRSRYDAHRVADEFAGSLRNRVDPDEVMEGWVEAVEKTMQPGAVGAWVKMSDSA